MGRTFGAKLLFRLLSINDEKKGKGPSKIACFHLKRVTGQMGEKVHRCIGVSVYR